MLLVTAGTCLAQAAAPAAATTGQPAATTAQPAAATTGQPAADPQQNGGSAPAAQGEGTAQGPSGPTEQKPEQGPEPTAQDGFKMGAFTFKPGGRVKLDVIRDFKPVGSEDSFDTRTIPVDGSEGTNSNIHAKETRLNLDIRGMAEERELRMFIETDFYGTSSALRLRHAYGSYGGLLAGQTWSTFMDDDNLPRTIDFESPTAFAQIRQAQARWTQKLGAAITWAASVEDNKSAIVLPANTPGKAEYPMPDLVTRFRFDVPRGHVTTSAFLGAARFRPTDGDADSVTLWGSMASAKFSPFGQDSIYGVFTYGEGIGRYRGGTTAIPDEAGKLHAVGGVAFMGGYEHFWLDRWSTNAVYSVSDTADEAFYTSAVNKQLTYFAANLLYWFLGDRAWTGVEYLYGHREVFGDAGDSGAAHRVQYAVRFNLP
jgi:outer membrane DcaP-like protein